MFSESKINSDSEQLYQHLWTALDGLENAILNVDLIIDRVQNNPFAIDDRDDRMNQLRHVSDADDDIEGYDSEGDMVELKDDLTDEGRDMILGSSIKFSPGEEKTLVMQVGTRFHNSLVFYHALKALAQRDGFNICRVENSGTCINCECSDI